MVGTGSISIRPDRSRTCRLATRTRSSWSTTWTESTSVAAGTAVPDVNLEIIEPGPEANAITMRVHERGVGITEACGTGACAAAWAAREWGIAGHRVVVHMLGGDGEVTIDGEGVTLAGPAVHIAEIEVSA